MNKNSENPKVGKDFENETLEWAQRIFGCNFENEKAIKIGNPPTPHKFDLVSEDESIVIECKCYTWTESGNVPSAKLATLDEAILYMRSIAHPAKKIIALSYALNGKRNQTLAEYFCERKGHILGDISVWELDGIKEPRLIREGE